MKATLPASFSRHLGALLRDENLCKLHGKKKVQHILAYYKFPLAVICLVLYFIGWMIYGHLTHREVLLYTALVNVNTGETLTSQLGADFIDYLNADETKYTMQLYTGLYLTDDEQSEWHQYTYASRMKILAAIEGKMMDVVVMNREAFDAFSQSGYLLDLDHFLSSRDQALYQALKPALAANTIILEDNVGDIEEHCFGLNLSETAYIRQAGFTDTVYLGIIANTPRSESVLAYLRYLTLAEN